MHFDDQDRPCDFTYLAVNSAFEAQTGLRNVVGRKVSEIIPGIREADPKLFEIYGRVAKTGRPERFEIFVDALQMFFLISVYRPERGYFVALFDVVTERKQAEAALKESEAKYRRFYNETPVLLHSIDRNGTVVEVNDYWLKTLGYERDEVVGKKLTDFHSEASQKYAQEVIHPAFFRDGVVNEVAYQFVKKNGEVLDMVLSATAERDAAGNVVRSLAVSEDVTERKRTEEALSKSEKMLQTIFDAEPECVKVLDEHANLIMMNRAGLNMLQADSLELGRGRCVCPLITSEYRPAFMELTKRVFQGESGTLLFEIVGLKGRPLWLETHAVPLRNERDEIVSLLGVTRDVTERKRAEEEIREKEGKYRGLFETAKDGIFMLDETVFTDCNQKGAEMYGLTKKEVIGRSPFEFAPERQPDGRLSADVAGEKTRAAQNSVPQIFEWQLLRADGSFFDVEITLSRLELGGKVYLQAIVRDISERRRLEQERLKSQKLESLGTLAGGIAHDFNNLLQGIFGYISMAKMTLDQKERSKAMLEQAEKALHQSVNLTTQLLTFSRGGKPVKKLFSLQPLIENSARFALSGSSTTYELRIDPGLWQIEADEGQLGQVIQNIVLNADQAMPFGRSVVISARNISASDASLPQELNGRDAVLIAIQDSGVGIPEQYLCKIFDPYFTTKEKGSGLGLATSYSIIKSHGGLVRVRSEVGKGTTFLFYLPGSGENMQKSESKAIQAGPRKGRILVMDDEEMIRMVAEEILNELGHEVALADKGETALDAYRAARAAGRPFDIVILDLTIRGGMGGVETMRKLLEVDPEVKTIVSSGYSDDAALANYREQGFRAFLKKPYDMRALQDMLQDLL
jgi:two-component system, cell cycle sensor histidine kinase and response regulator CckA